MPNKREFSGRSSGHIGSSGKGLCLCWSVKGKDGNYLGVKSRQPVCAHYMPSAVTVNSME